MLVLLLIVVLHVLNIPPNTAYTDHTHIQATDVDNASIQLQQLYVSF